jgi:hypothetical protein
MRKKEQLLWDSMKRNCPSALDLQRVENVVGDGMPDVYVGRSGKWVELKAPGRVPVRPETPLLGKADGLRTSQVNWHMKHSSMNAPESFVLIRTPDGELIMIPGSAAPVINALPLRAARECSVASTWQQIIKALK